MAFVISNIRPKLNHLDQISNINIYLFILGVTHPKINLRYLIVDFRKWIPVPKLKLVVPRMLVLLAVTVPVWSSPTFGISDGGQGNKKQYSRYQRCKISEINYLIRTKIESIIYRKIDYKSWRVLDAVDFEAYTLIIVQ
jgi:hypothetical protein